MIKWHIFSILLNRVIFSSFFLFHHDLPCGVEVSSVLGSVLYDVIRLLELCVFRICALKISDVICIIRLSNLFECSRLFLLKDGSNQYNYSALDGASCRGKLSDVLLQIYLSQTTKNVLSC